MALGLQLSQRLGQSLVLAPQLQQSLALLQAPTLELKALVEQELQQNPVLEEVSSAEEAEEQEKSDAAGENIDPSEPPADITTSESEAEKGMSEAEFETEFQKLAQMDQEWRDQFSQANAPMRRSEEEDERRQFMFDSLTSGTSLQESLLEQMRTSELPEDERPIAEFIIGNINDYGYFSVKKTVDGKEVTLEPKAALEELSVSSGFSQQEIFEVLKVIQTFDPPGVASRDLRECLMVQLERGGQDKTQEYRIIQDHFEAMGKRRIPKIAKGLGISIEDAQTALERISRLEPRPGRAYLPDNDQYILPEVFIQKNGEDFVVTTNNEQIPHLRISNIYKDLMSRTAVDVHSLETLVKGIKAGAKTHLEHAIAAIKSHEDTRAMSELRKLEDFDSLTKEQKQIVHVVAAQVQEKQAFVEARNYIREKIRAGKFLIKSLDQRQSTILNIAKEILKRQREFMEKGIAHLRPLTMVQVADVVGVHETTVSRAVSGKYMQTPQGIFEMKYFFTAGIQTSDGGGMMSNTSVKDMIAEMFKKEDAGKPLSDQEIVKMLKDKNVVIARRTVAKYRAELSILPSNLRKVY